MSHDSALDARAGEADAPPSATDFVDELVVCLAALRIHGDADARALDVARGLERTLARLLAAAGETRLELCVEQGYLVHAGRPLLGATLSGASLLQALARARAGGLSFARGASAAEILALARRLQPGLAAGTGAAPASATAAPARAALLAAEAAPAHAAPHLAPVLDLERPVRFYQRLVDHLQEVTVRVGRRESFGLERTRGLVEALVERDERDPGALLSLSRYERYDAFTFGHSIRVALLALEFARAHGDDRERHARLTLAALLHDIGKAWLPFDVLFAGGHLDAQQRARMELHAEHGGALLAALDADPLCSAVAFGHHLRHAGGGYPRTLHEPRLSAATRLVKICDVFEALTAPRPHRAALAPARAYRIMLAMTGHFDPLLLRRFVEVHGIHPVGTRVRLSSGESARVVGQSQRLDRPRVAIASAEDGSPLPHDPQAVVDLSDPREPRSITAPLAPPDADSLAA